MKYSNLLWLVLLITVACQPRNQEISRETVSNDNGKLLIIGGGKRGEALVSRMIVEAGLDTGGYAIILPMSSSEPDSSVFYAKKQFTAQNINNVLGLHFQKDSIPDPVRLDSIRNASLIYISGGDQNRFMATVKDTEIEKAIIEAYQKGRLIAGTSAGAAVMSKKMITGNELKHPEYSSTFRNIEANNIELKEGLGLVENAIIDQHFVKRSRHNRLISAVAEHPDVLGIGIDESTAILIDQDSAEVVGVSQVLVFKNNNADIDSSENGLLGTKGIELNIYLPGEKFSIKK